MQRSFFNTVFIGLCVVFYLFFVFLPVATWNTLFSFGSGEPVEFFVEQGMTPTDVGSMLQEMHLVTDGQALTHEMSRMGVDKSLKPGLYSARPGTPWEVAMQLQGLRPRASALIIRPGMYVSDVVALAGVSEKAFESALLSDDLFPEILRPVLPQDATTRAAFLLPGTYAVADSEDVAATIVRKSAEAWGHLFAPTLAGFDADHLMRLASLASIVEKEAPSAADQPGVAGVFINRLQTGMPLQSTAALRLAWREKGHNIRHLAHNDFKIDSPFNTFLYPGLPPQPICIPSGTAWEAARNPLATDALYFAVGKDGKTAFAKNYGDYLTIQKILPEAQ